VRGGAGNNMIIPPIYRTEPEGKRYRLRKERWVPERRQTIVFKR